MHHVVMKTFESMWTSEAEALRLGTIASQVEHDCSKICVVHLESVLEAGKKVSEALAPVMEEVLRAHEKGRAVLLIGMAPKRDYEKALSDWWSKLCGPRFRYIRLPSSDSRLKKALEELSASIE